MTVIKLLPNPIQQIFSTFMNSDHRLNFNFNFKIDVNVDLCLFVGFIFEVEVKFEVETEIWLARRRENPLNKNRREFHQFNRQLWGCKTQKSMYSSSKKDLIRTRLKGRLPGTVNIGTNRLFSLFWRRISPFKRSSPPLGTKLDYSCTRKSIELMRSRTTRGVEDWS